MALERGHHEACMRANVKARHFETRSKRVSLTLTIMRMNVYALIAWLRACVINGWLGTPVLNPELERSAPSSAASTPKCRPATSTTW
jgi:uncharacterized membrane protein (DUF485 family)